MEAKPIPDEAPPEDARPDKPSLDHEKISALLGSFYQKYPTVWDAIRAMHNQELPPNPDEAPPADTHPDEDPDSPEAIAKAWSLEDAAQAAELRD